MLALEAGAEDLKSEDNVLKIYTTPEILMLLKNSVADAVSKL